MADVVASEDNGAGASLSLVVSRDWDGFAREWGSVADRLFRVALMVSGGDRATAEDACADALLATYPHWLAGRVDDVGPYARRAVVNGLIGRARRLASAQRYIGKRRGDDRGVIDLVNNVVDHTVLWEAVRALPPRQRAVIALRFYERLSVAECAEALGVSTGTVKSTTSDALSALRRVIGGDDDGR